MYAFRMAQDVDQPHLVLDNQEPLCCILSQFHVTFVYDNNVTVISLITDKVAFCKKFQVHDNAFKLDHMSLDINQQKILMLANRSQLMTSTVADESVDAWRLLFN